MEVQILAKEQNYLSAILKHAALAILVGFSFSVSTKTSHTQKKNGRRKER